MADILSELLRQYGGKQQPLLMNPAPQLTGAMASVQPMTPQPVLPQAGVPAAPQPQRSQSTAMSLLDAMRRSGGQDQQPQAQAAPQSPVGGSGSLLDSLNLPYWQRQMFGYSGGAPIGGSVALPTMANISLPSLSSFAL